LPGGFGTLDEIFEALTLGQLGIETKPVGILNTNGFFNHLIKQLDVMVTEGYLKQSNKEMLIISESVPDLIAQMFSYKAPEMTKVINKIVK
ncbi:MAG: LOG family protein, partial [Lutibacter sp.]